MTNILRQHNNTQLIRKHRVQAIIKLGARCKKCKFDDIRALQIDHIKNDGKTERAKRFSINTRIIKGTVEKGRYQLLCANCNTIKRTQNQRGCNRYLLSINKKLKK